MAVQIAKAVRSLQRLPRQVDFATARALTWTARDAQMDLTADLPEIFESPTPFTRRAIAIIPAKRDTRQAFVLVKDKQREYLEIQATGGTRRSKPGSPIVVPVGISLNRYGNIARGRLGRLKQKDNIFAASPDQASTRHLRPGIYRRYRRGARGKQKRPRLLAAFERSAQYVPRLDMHRRVNRTVRRRFNRNFSRSLRQALATAR